MDRYEPTFSQVTGAVESNGRILVALIDLLVRTGVLSEGQVNDAVKVMGCPVNIVESIHRSFPELGQANVDPAMKAFEKDLGGGYI
jgi:hypothetical protein